MRTIAAIITIPLLIAGALLTASPATADSSVERIAGIDRYATSVAIAEKYQPGVPVVYVATGSDYPDALSAAPAAASLGGPLLLTAPATLPSNVRAEIQRLTPALVVVVGGSGAVSDSVYRDLSTLAPMIRRDEGVDRYATSLVVNARAFPASTTKNAFFATGANFPDALSAAAAAGSTGSPVVLVNGFATGLDAQTSGLLDTLGVETATIAGGTGVVSVQIENALNARLGDSAVTRLAGEDRYGTSIAINSASFTTADTAYFAVGSGFADALAGAALAGHNNSPLFVVPSSCVPAGVISALSSLGTTHRVLFGGVSVLSGAVQSLTQCFSPSPIPRDGSYRVGSEVPAGTWVTSGSTDFCYWERVSSFDGQLESIIANDIGDGQRIVTIAPTDVGFTTEGCGSWVGVQNAPALINIPSDGVFVVGQQIQPGLYRANPASSCYWATLSGFSGELSDIVANDNVTGQTTVQIDSSVRGFESSGCGTWSRIG
jgi:putative cell wall-binding protein